MSAPVIKFDGIRANFEGKQKQPAAPVIVHDRLFSGFKEREKMVEAERQPGPAVKGASLQPFGAENRPFRSTERISYAKAI